MGLVEDEGREYPAQASFQRDFISNSAPTLPARQMDHSAQPLV
jgi:hypothetical protein